MNSRHRVPRGINSQLNGSTIEKKIAKVTVGKSTGGSVGLVRERYVSVEGHRLYCLEAGGLGAGDDPLVLLCHGFPELAYSWRNQIDAIAAAGFHVVAPDLPGYGRSDKPDVAYDIEFVNGLLAGLITATGHETAVLAGHDWGGLLVWAFARMFPERTAGVIGVNTPDLPRPYMPPVELLRQIFVDTPIYIIQFQTPGLAEWVFSWGRGADDFIDMIFLNEMNRNPAAFPPEVLEVYKEAFRPVGALTPPIDYYRNMDRNWHLTAAVADRLIEVPCLMICAENDPVLSPAMSEGMEERVPDLERVLIRDCGHWTQQERPEETTAAMLGYLKRFSSR
jgi:pimeloyl-ACP methyl ester carboxylesterase